MDVSGEISQKIRSAIKAKLVDLGAYVDDELPDYIMVMVANKKTKEQMTDDLNLFLGNNTEKFTAWLCILLDKLQYLTAEASGSGAEDDALSSKPQEEAVPDVESPPEKKSKKTESSEKKKPKETAHKDTILKKDDQAESTATETSRKRSISDDQGAGATISPPKKAKTSDHSDSGREKKVEEVSNIPEIELDAGKDIFEDVLDTPFEQAHSKGRSRGRSVSETKPTASRVQGKAPLTGVASPIRHRKDQTEHTTSRASAKSVHQRTRHPVSSRLGVHPDSKNTASTEKRRALSSTIGAVVKRAVEEVEEEEYDPYKPAIGNVASVVKVTERKCKVPSTWQADKSILLKAMNAAQDSIQKSKRTEKAVVKPVVHEPPSKQPRSAVHSRLGDHQHRKSSKGMRSDTLTTSKRESRKRERSPPRKSSSERSIQIFRKSADEEVFSRIKSKVGVKLHKKLKGEESTRSKKEVKAKEVSEEELSAKEEEQEDSGGASSGEEHEEQLDEDILDILIPEDNRLIEYDIEEELAVKKNVRPYRATPIGHQQSLATLIESGAEESDFTDGEGDDSRVVKESHRSRSIQERPPSPKFVVTLDGVDPTLLKKDVKFDSDSDAEISEIIEESPTKERNIVRVEPRPHRPIAPTIMVNLADSDENDGNDSMDKTILKPAEKCHFWPNCKNGDACPYHHPTETCRKFPQCQFGDKCLFVHPKCKFDVNCTRSGCAFSHSVRKPNPAFATSVPVIVQPIRVPMYPGGMFTRPRAPRPAATQHPSQVTCRFFPNCTNMNCPFNHPKPCRFGISCNNKEKCLFGHPNLPAKDKLSWSTKTAKSPISPTTDAKAALNNSV